MENFMDKLKAMIKVNLCLIAIGLYITLIIACAICFFSEPPVFNNDDKYEDIVPVSSGCMLPKEILCDTNKIAVVMLDSTRIAHWDSTLAFTDQTLKRIHQVELRNRDLIDDVRQETNNIINKVNGWLGFWIAVLALVGGIVPIVIQFVYMHGKNKDFDKLSAQVTNEFETIKTEFQDIKNNNENEQSNFKVIINANRLCTYVNTICVNLDNRLMADTSIRKSLQKYLANKMLDVLKMLDPLFYDAGTCQLHLDNEPHLVVLLVQIGALLDQCQLIDDGRRRDIDQLKSRIEIYLSQILRGDRIENSIDRVETYRSFIRILRECFSIES